MSSAVEEIKSKVSLVDLVNRYTQVKKEGRLYKACCPFHTEKTPSFVIYEEDGRYHCYGCGVSGDVITFIREKEELDFHEAIDRLADDYHIDISSFKYTNQKKYDDLYKLNKFVARHFHEALKQPKNPCYKYIHKRGISDKSIVIFGLGYADEKQDSLLKELEKNGYKQGDALKVDALKNIDGRVRDAYFSRLMFPIINSRDKVIGFGGRDITGKAKAKYLNSKDSEIFHKGENLFGINLAKSRIAQKGYAIIVEGYMDVVSLYDKGVENVIATLGTALTTGQANVIKKYTNNVILCYDSDDAGIKNAIKGIDILRSVELNVKVLNVSDGKDPDEFISKHGREAFLEEVDKSINGIEYKLRQLRRGFDFKKSEANLEYIRASMDILTKISPIEADYYVKWLAKRTGITEGAINEELTRSGGANGKQFYVNKNRGRRENLVNNSEYVALQRLLIRLYLYDPTFSARSDMSSVFIGEDYYRLADAIKTIQKKSTGKEFDIMQLREVIGSQEISLLDDILANIPLTADPSHQYEECEKRVEVLKLTQRHEDVIRILDIEEDAARKHTLTLELKEISRKLAEYKRR